MFVLIIIRIVYRRNVLATKTAMNCRGYISTIKKKHSKGI